MVYWTAMDLKEWRIFLAVTQHGLCFAGNDVQNEAELSKWIHKMYPNERLQQNDEVLQPYMAQFLEYLDGERKEFTFPLAFEGTPFQKEVWQALQMIPYGTSCSYGEIAERIGRPKAVRAVGTAIGQNPIMITIPCHRVIGKNGKLTGFRGGLAMKEQLLQLEAITYRV